MRDAVLEQLIAVANAGTLTTFRVPSGDGTFCLSIDATMMRQAQNGWRGIAPVVRASVLRNVKRAIKSGLKRHRRGTLTQEQCNAFAFDCALWFVHELMFADGEKHVVNGPDAAAFRKLAN